MKKKTPQNWDGTLATSLAPCCMYVFIKNKEAGVCRDAADGVEGREDHVVKRGIREQATSAALFFTPTKDARFSNRSFILREE
ncbi:hypothetical protein GOP47_0026581 [Adiantum capillus-veneris]|nr:hypothetical protein GOP47_0026581 [Adiantum capillus-veneris]